MNKEDLQKQIELLVKDDERSQQTIINQRQEIERLTKQNKALNEMYELTKKEYIRLNNIINELKEWFKGYHKSYASCKWYEEDYIEFIEHLEEELKGSDK